MKTAAQLRNARARRSEFRVRGVPCDPGAKTRTNTAGAGGNNKNNEKYGAAEKHLEAIGGLEGGARVCTVSSCVHLQDVAFAALLAFPFQDCVFFSMALPRPLHPSGSGGLFSKDNCYGN